MLFRFTVRSSDAPERFDPSAFVLPFDDRLRALDFGREMLKTFAVYAGTANAIAINVSPVAYGSERPAGRRTATPAGVA
jgi:hypothetical protein